MTPTPVGMRCPECSNQRTRVTRGVPGPAAGVLGAFPATVVLIAINVIVFLVEVGSGSGGIGEIHSTVIGDFGLRGISVADGEWYRLLTSGFLHAGLIHIAFNMFLLFVLGRLLEPAIGTPRFLALYFASLFAGSLGALALTNDLEITIGASGAIFGVLGATVLIARNRGNNQVAGELGILLLINLAYSFGANHVSVGGHIGGLVGGVHCGLAILAGERGMLGRNRLPVELGVMAAVGVASILLSIAIA
jgi:membrane associated rhomboid family serine protease